MPPNKYHSRKEKISPKEGFQNNMQISPSHLHMRISILPGPQRILYIIVDQCSANESQYYV